MNADKLFFKQAHVLAASVPSARGNLLAAVDEWRASQQLPLCTGMLPIALPLCTAEARVPEDTRALWQMGLLQQLKNVPTGISIMRRALVPLWAQPDTMLGQIALAIEGLLLADTPALYPHTAAACFAQFDRLLKEPKINELNRLWVEVHFYATETLVVSVEGKVALKKRIQSVAASMAAMLVVKENTDTASKKALYPYYLALTDGLLFLGEETVLKRLEKLYAPLPSSLLNISVPVQKLWAQCLSLSCGK